MLYPSFTVALNSGVVTSLSESAAIRLASGIYLCETLFIVMRVTWNAINVLLQSDWSAQHSKPVESAQKYFFRADSPRPLVIRACVHVGKIRLAGPRD